VVELLGAVEVGSFSGLPSDRYDPGAGSAEAVAGTRLYHGKAPSLGCACTVICGCSPSDRYGELWRTEQEAEGRSGTF